MKKALALLLAMLLCGCAESGTSSQTTESVASEPAQNSVPLTVGTPEGIRIERVLGYNMPVRDGSLGITIPCVVGTAFIRDNRPITEEDKTSLKVYFPMLTAAEMETMTKSDMQEKMDLVELSQTEIELLKKSPGEDFSEVDLTDWTWGDVKAYRSRLEAERRRTLPENAVTALGVTVDDYYDLTASLRESVLTDEEIAAMGTEELRSHLTEIYLSRIEQVLRFTYLLSEEQAETLCAQLR